MSAITHSATTFAFEVRKHHWVALLVATLTAVAVALLFVAPWSNDSTSTVTAPSISSQAAPYYGGHDEGTLSALSSTLRYDGGHEEGIAGR